MKSYISHIILLLILIISLEKLNAQDKKSQLKFAVIDLVVKDTSMLKNGMLEFVFYQNGINTNFSSNTKKISFKISRLETRIKIPFYESLNYGRINYIFDGQENNRPLDWENNLFIFENRDSVRMILTKQTVTFQGKSAAKFKCQYNINEQKIVASSKAVDEFYKQGKYEDMVKAKKQQLDSLYQVKLAILKSAKPFLHSEVYKLISTDCLGYIKEQLLGFFIAFSRSDLPRGPYDAFIHDRFNWYMDLNAKQKYDADILSKSYKYCDFLLWMEMFKVRFYNSPQPGTYNNNYSFAQLYRSIKKNYNGILQDKVNLVALYAHLTGKEDAKFFLDSAIQNATKNRFKTELIRLSMASGKAYPFELPDQYGKIHKLSDYAGKVVIMDFWFTGCIGCATLAIQMKPIIKYYASNKNVVFITVSIDKSREAWIKSLAQEIYSSKDEINLYTGGKGDGHPLIQNYNIQGFPTLLIFSKDGTLVSSAPAMPTSGKPETVAAFRKLIDTQL